MEPIAKRTNYSPETGYIMLDIDKPGGLPAHVEVDDMVYTLKDELHLSLIDTRRLAADLQADENQLRKTFADVATTAQFGVVTFKTPLYECRKEKGTDSSIVIGVEIVGLQAMFQLLRARTKLAIPDPFPHVTLYTSGNPHGVAVRSRQQLHERGRRFDAPELETILIPPVAKRPSFWDIERSK